MAADCKSAGLTPYVGSNPTPTTGGRGSCSAGREWDGAGVRVASGRGSRLPAGVAQLVERQPSKLRVAGSSPVSRSKPSLVRLEAHVAQAVEHFLGKEEVTGSNPVVGS